MLRHIRAWRSNAGTRRTGEAVFPCDGAGTERSTRDATCAGEVVARTAGVRGRQSVRSEQPPRLATWLLRHFGSSPNMDAIVGDLNEQYRQGRSRGWCWMQVLIAILLNGGQVMLKCAPTVVVLALFVTMLMLLAHGGIFHPADWTATVGM